MEILLARPDEMDRVVEIVRALIEPDADITASTVEAVVRFRTVRGEEELAGLLRTLVVAGLGVTQFREVQTDLEEAFMILARDAGDVDETADKAGAGRA